MRQFFTIVFASFVLFYFTGCSRPYVTGSNELGVTVCARAKYTGRAMELAQHECEAYGKSAKLTGADSQNYIFQCVEDSQHAQSISRDASDNPEKALWDEVQKSNTIEDYKAYLEQYPQGIYMVLAKSRIKNLKNQEGTSLKKSSNTEVIAGTIFRDCPDCPEMVIIPPGSFKMGSDSGRDDVKPIHQVTISKPFALGKTEVTQGEWKAIMGKNPSKFSECGDTCPVDSVSWNDAKEYINKLNIKTGKQYRLPSESEWEYACNDGGQSNVCEVGVSDNNAWFANNSESKTHPTAAKLPNALGLYDMNGNVWEWVEDKYYRVYNAAPKDGSAWEGSGDYRVLRGGAYWTNNKPGRGYHYPSKVRKDYGFRLARDIP